MMYINFALHAYTKALAACGGFDDHHSTLSGDPMRVVSFPGSVNSETGLMYRYLGGPEEFMRASISDVVWRSRAVRYFYNVDFARATYHAHPEPVGAMTMCAKTGGYEHG
jgi:hypothetical protein